MFLIIIAGSLSTLGFRIQYVLKFFTGVPEALVVTHVLGAVLLTSTAAAVAMATRFRPATLPR